MLRKCVALAVLVGVMVGLSISVAQAANGFPGGKRTGKTHWIVGTLPDVGAEDFWPVIVEAPLDMDIQTLVGNNHDTVLNLYQMNGTERTLIATNDDGGRAFGSRIRIALAPGNYEIGVSSYQSQWAGSYRLRYSWKFAKGGAVPPPPPPPTAD
jgi:hypothetical protein